MSKDRAIWWLAGFEDNGTPIYDLSSGTPRQLALMIDTLNRSLQQKPMEGEPTATHENLLQTFRTELGRRTDR